MHSEELSTRFLKGSAWMLGMRWSMRFIGLISMSIVARLLIPDDFGVFAVASTLIGLLDALTDIGSDTAIIRHTNPQRQHYDTVWTLKLLVNSGAALIIVLFTPLSDYIYSDTRYGPVLYAMALSIFINGIANIGIADFRRNLQFHKDFQFTLAAQLVGVASTIIAAFLLRSYWALVIGTLSRSICATLLSFLMHSYRPRLSLAARKEMFGFSFWLMLRSLAIFLTARGDRLVVGAYYNPTITAWFAISSDLAQMAVFELLHPIGRALLPGLAAKQQDKDWEQRNLKKIFNGTATIATATGFGLAALAEPAMSLIYGENFSAAAPLLSLLAFASALDGFSQPVGQYLVVHGKTKELAILFMLGGSVSVGLAYVLAEQGADIRIIGYARLSVAFFSLMRVFYLLKTLQSMRWQDVAVAWLRPLIAGFALYAALFNLQEMLSIRHIAELASHVPMPLWETAEMPNVYRIAILAIGIPLGALVYCTALMGVWYVIGRPPGIEEEIMQRLVKRQ